MYPVSSSRPLHGPRHALRRAAAACVLVLLSAGALHAQDHHAVRGQVLNPAGHPLSGAAVEVLGTYWGTLTRADGRFALSLPEGNWRLRFSQIGFRPDTLEVEVSEARLEPLVVRLAESAIDLRGISVEAARTPPMAQTVTTATVRQVPPLLEPDVFRALVLLPGVSQPNDLKGRIHLAGGASDETGVRLDGHPLQDPFHLFGILGAFNIAALERADVLIHHLPPSMGGVLSGVLDLETRRPRQESSGEAVVSLLASSLTVVQPVRGFDVLASGRFTYLGPMLELLAGDTRVRGEEIPRFGFRDGLLRLGRSWGNDWRMEAIGFTTEDVLHSGDLSMYPGYRPLSWGESLVGVRLRNSGPDWRFLGRASFNRATVHLDERPAEGTAFADSRWEWWSAAAELTRSGRRGEATLGAALDRRRLLQEWTALGFAYEIFSPNTPSHYAGEESQQVLGLFGEGSFRMGDRWTGRAGARYAYAGDAWHAEPRLVVEYRATERLRLHGAVNRRHQFDTQLEEPVEGSIRAPQFLLERPRSADVVALVADWRGGADAASPTPPTLRVEGFGKRYRDRPLLQERDLTLRRDEIGPDFPEFERITGYSAGLMLSGRWAFAHAGLLQGSYTYQRVRERIEGQVYPTAWDAPHSLSLFTSVPLPAQWTFNTVYQAHSGRATTPVLARLFMPYPEVGPTLRTKYLMGERNSVRVPPYHRLDLGARRTWERLGADWTLSLQVLNVLWRTNPIDYDWENYYARLADKERSERFQTARPGLPLLPTLGLEVSW